MLKSNLCDKSNAYIILKGTVTIPGQAADAPAHEADRAKKQITSHTGYFSPKLK